MFSLRFGVKVIYFFHVFFSRTDVNLGIESQSHEITGHGDVRKSGGSGGGLVEIVVLARG